MASARVPNEHVTGVNAHERTFLGLFFLAFKAPLCRGVVAATGPTARVRCGLRVGRHVNMFRSILLYGCSNRPNQVQAHHAACLIRLCGGDPELRVIFSGLRGPSCVDRYRGMSCGYECARGLSSPSSRVRPSLSSARTYEARRKGAF